MKSITQEWVDIAEADYKVALLIRKSRTKRSRELSCFHLQQSAEKYLKARLIEAGILFPKTHDLKGLLDLVVTVEPLWIPLRPALVSVSNHAVESRYPGRGATPAEAKIILGTTTRLRKLVRLSLGLN
jgi:HEPN domain-containing protein